MPFLIVGIVGHGAMRSFGKSLLPSSIMVTSALINIGLTPTLLHGWFIFPRLQIEGVALATSIARVFNLVVTLIFLGTNFKIFSQVRFNLSEMMENWKKVLRIGLPASIANVSDSIGISIATKLLSTYGASAVAAFGVATRIESLAILPILALGTSYSAFAGQNYGASKTQRIKKGFHLGIGLSLINAIAIFTAAKLLGTTITNTLASDEKVAQIALDYIVIVSVSLLGFGIYKNTAAILNGVDRAKTALGITAFRKFLLYVPLIWIAKEYFDLVYVFWAVAVTNLISGIIAYFVFSRWLKTTSKK